MDLAACRTGHRLIYVVVLRNIFGRKALNAIPDFRAAVHEERHLKIYSRSTSQNGLIYPMPLPRTLVSTGITAAKYSGWRACRLRPGSG